jgi:acetate kinase
MRDLLARRAADVPAAEAVALFCYQARKWIAAMAAAMEGLDALVFSGGIGEHAPEVRAEICAGLAFLGAVAVRVIPTDEEIVIARIVRRILLEGTPHG